MVRIVLIGLVQQRIQICVSLHHGKGHSRVVLRQISHTVYIDFYTALRCCICIIKLNTHIVFPFGKPWVESSVLQAKVPSPENKGSRAAAFCKGDICRNVEYSLGGCIQRQVR